MFVCLFIYSFVFCFNLRRIPKGSFPQNFVKIGLDLAEILRISKLDWRDGGEGEKKGSREGGEQGRRGGILLCNGLIIIQDHSCKKAKNKAFFYIFIKMICKDLIL